MSAATAAESPERRRSEAVAWLRALLRESALPLPLPPPRASDDELRAALADGALLRAALDKLARPASPRYEGGAAAERDVGRFLAAVERMGLPSFAPSDLETGPMSAVVACLLALRDRFVSHAGEGWTCGLPQNGRMHTVGFPRRENGQVTQNSEVREDVKQMETTLQKVSKSPAMSARHAGRNFHEVFQLRQGGYSDLPSSKISDMMKSTSLDNAPTQSLLSVVNGILDEIIERKNGEIPYHLAFLLRKIILEVERRISTQAEHIRNQNNLMKAREEKYKSRIRVLEALASGTSGQIHVSSNAANGKAHVAAEPVHRMKMEKDKFEEKRQLLEEDQTKLTKDKENVTTLTKDKEDMTRLLNDKEDIIRLMKEKEEMARLIKEKEDTVILKKGKDGDRNQSADEHIAKPIMYKDELISLMKEKENYKVTIMKLKLELEANKSSCEKSHSLLETKNKDVVNLLKDKENSGNVISQLRQELAMARRSHETYIQDLKTTALQENRNFEQRIKEVELKLEDSTKRERYLEELLEARIQTWEQKEIMLNQFVGLQMQNIQDLRLSSVSIRHEIQNCQKRWSEELSGLGQSLKVLANASEKYHAALEENRKLFNEVQELKGNIRVFCRIRPFLPNEDHKSSTTEITGDNGELILANPTKIGKEGNKLFKFNKVLGPTTSQDEVFRDIQPLVRSVLDGYNVCIFAYGQTGSGKTYTMTGPEDATEEELGVNFRALNDLFLISRNRGDTFNYEVSVQMIEIYNEQIHDLLGSNGSEKNLGILNSSHPNGLAVPDATLHPVNSTTDVIELMRTGLGNRSVGATALNERSSRSHSVVTVHVQGEDLKTGATLRGALHLVDLAGSERVDRSAVTGDRLKEAQHINKSLSALGDVIFSLSQKTSHVPYRNSKLTQVLQSSLGGHAKTLMFVQINPDVSSYAESLSTLRFAERVSGVELGAAKANKEGKDIKEFKEQLSLLKDKIAKKDEEINQLQTHSPRVKTGKRADSLLKHSSSSPGISSLGSKMQHRRTASGGKAMGLISRAGSDADNFSEISDRHSETSSMQSIDDIQQQREIMVLSKLPEDDMGPNSADPELASFGYADSEGRLSDISDSGISMGTETDGSISSMVDFALFPEQEKIASTWKEQETAPNTPKDRLPKVTTRVQKATTPKTAPSSSVWPKSRDSTPRSSASASTRRSTITQATSSPRTSNTPKRWN
ncbi:kinesin-like protein KIN-14M isoform X2 [Triticum aestivum]|uniref:kinesin-like protein KIN-14M isoform X2 n=1 Tax=Triticum aestivum TaxID=4565 RepID=UPI001D0264BB|nr:kinesin-like protein KIN-14M isoform X2 [Triticum aestivum]